MLPPIIVRAICEGKDPKTALPKSHSLVPGRYIAAADIKPGEVCEFASRDYFLLCGVGGMLACGSTHTLIVPLDLVKCRIQVDKEKYRNLFHGFKVTIAEDGVRGLAKGWFPTLVGYSLQGTAKFGYYELFKVIYKDMLSEENAYLWRTSLYLCASATAEFIADVGLSPFEAVKVKIQTSTNFANTFREAVPKMYAEEGVYAFFKSLVPLWGRQIPYTMMKFTSFERTLELLYIHVVPKPRLECSKPEQLVVTFTAGYIAGIFCALVSHPADTLVSKLNQKKGTTVGELVKELGFMGLWGGLVPRIIMIGTLTALQWFIYDGFKVAVGMPRPPPPEMPESLKRKLHDKSK